MQTLKSELWHKAEAKDPYGSPRSLLVTRQLAFALISASDWKIEMERVSLKYSVRGPLLVLLGAC